MGRQQLCVRFRRPPSTRHRHGVAAVMRYVDGGSLREGLRMRACACALRVPYVCLHMCVSPCVCMWACAFVLYK